MTQSRIAAALAIGALAWPGLAAAAGKGVCKADSPQYQALSNAHYACMDAQVAGFEPKGASDLGARAERMAAACAVTEAPILAFVARCEGGPASEAFAVALRKVMVKYVAGGLFTAIETPKNFRTLSRPYQQLIAAGGAYIGCVDVETRARTDETLDRAAIKREVLDACADDGKTLVDAAAAVPDAAAGKATLKEHDEQASRAIDIELTQSGKHGGPAPGEGGDCDVDGKHVKHLVKVAEDCAFGALKDIKDTGRPAFEMARAAMDVCQADARDIKDWVRQCLHEGSAPVFMRRYDLDLGMMLTGKVYAARNNARPDRQLSSTSPLFEAQNRYRSCVNANAMALEPEAEEPAVLAGRAIQACAKYGDTYVRTLAADGTPGIESLAALNARLREEIAADVSAIRNRAHALAPHPLVSADCDAHGPVVMQLMDHYLDCVLKKGGLLELSDKPARQVANEALAACQAPRAELNRFVQMCSKPGIADGVMSDFDKTYSDDLVGKIVRQRAAIAGSRQ